MPKILNYFSSALSFITIIILGISAGASLAEEVLFVPFWKSLSPLAFYEWYATNSAMLVAFYSPLQIWSTVLPLFSFVILKIANKKEKWNMLAAFLFSVGVLVTFFIYFKGANAEFTNRTISPENLNLALTTWGNWQWIRIGLQIGAFGSAILPIRSQNKL